MIKVNSGKEKDQINIAYSSLQSHPLIVTLYISTEISL